MPHSRLATGLAAVLLILSAIEAPAAEQWHEIRSPHFVVVTDGGEKRGREVALRFEQMRIAFGAIFQKLSVNIPIPVEVVAFKNSKELRRYSPLWNGKPVEMSGYFLGGQEKDFVALDLSAEAGWQVVYHEYTHLLSNANFSDIPLWFNEGFAEYFSTLKTDSKRIEFGGMLESSQRVLMANRWMPLVALFSVRHDSPEYNENGDHRSMFYAESWLVVHYLMGSYKMKEFGAYMDLVNTHHVPVPQAIEKAFGMSPAQLEKALNDYMHHALFFHLPSPPGIDNTSGYSSRAISETDAAAVLADLHLHERDYQEAAVKEFEDVLAKQPDNGVAHRGLGYALFRKGDYQKAEEHFRKSVELNTADAQSHYFYALLLLRRAGVITSGGETQSFVMIGSGESQPMNVVKREVEAAIALNAEYADAYNLLAMSSAQLGDYAAAVAAESHAVQLDRHNEMYAMNLGQYYMAARNWKEAEAVMRILANSSNEPVALTAQSHLQNIDVARRFSESENPIAVTQERMPKSKNSSGTSAPASQPVAAPAVPLPVKFLKGKLVKVDCAADGGATLTVAAERSSWTLKTPNRKGVVLIGADNFSCDWHDVAVAVNYHKTAENEGSIMSLELQ